MKILICDDDPQMIRAMRIALTAHGYDVTAAANGTEAISAAARVHPDVLLIDMGMPDLDGTEVIEAVRGWSDAPVIVVSGRTASTSKVGALDAGADDYLAKPFKMEELLARLRAVARRPRGGAQPSTVEFGDVTVDLAATAVTRAGERVHLTPTEWRILEVLARNPGALVTRRTLLTEIWGAEQVTDSTYLRLYISQLRRKLEAVPSRPRHLLTVPGMGYRLDL